MRLIPTQSPGRGSRKARDFASEIVELRKQGYTLDAIRAALADAGIVVTISTVWREAKRVEARSSRSPESTAPPTRVPQSPQTAQGSGNATPAPVAAPAHPERLDGKKQAELFMNSQITNPLIRLKEQR